ncbi:hypothetical protein PILCRDRAFT_522128 [Piloderma croceum F 1598]|uniref:Uncharacterized protein n=1 Tax=Piloderma croceum (strain F 1598) TaxID=765440 RepID=A0A0C3FM87_PILCF|nr:hypothetical protein PILCRDRAFT_522128 [Piloderma croceum F 1598]
MVYRTCPPRPTTRRLSSTRMLFSCLLPGTKASVSTMNWTYHCRYSGSNMNGAGYLVPRSEAVKQGNTDQMGSFAFSPYPTSTMEFQISPNRRRRSVITTVFIHSPSLLSSLRNLCTITQP